MRLNLLGTAAQGLYAGNRGIEMMYGQLLVLALIKVAEYHADSICLC